jgi:heme ABC exporter ATP-binding subunit CcmA
MFGGIDQLLAGSTEHSGQRAATSGFARGAGTFSGDPMDPAVHLRGAVCLLGRFPALAGADLDVTAGEVVLLRGPNGAGKTTLLRALAGLLPITRGEAVVLGHDLVRDRKAVRAHVGYLGHSPGLYDDLTVQDNLRFWARAARSDVGDALDRTGVDARLHAVAVARLSAGQRRRVALAALLVRRPRLWLLDEPHAALDGPARDVVDALVREAAAGGATVVLASHELDRAQAIADRTVVVTGGMVEHEEPARVA